jgi:hypothetical protein
MNITGRFILKYCKPNKRLHTERYYSIVYDAKYIGVR